jgi:DNA-binding transcriptional LysR family regulator
MRKFDLESLDIFRTVVAEGGVLRAAARLNRVQSNVTTRVRQLEERLGVALFRRVGRGLRLTAEGHRLLTYAEQLLRLADEADVALLGGKPSGRFRLGATEAAAGVRLPPILARYHAANPEVSLELCTGPTDTLIQKVQKFDIDAAFVSEAFLAPDLRSLPVFEEDLVLIGPPGSQASPISALATRTLVAFAQGCSYRRLLEKWMASEAVTPERVMEIRSYHAMAACVAAGVGVAIMPCSVLDSLPSGVALTRYPLPPAIARSRTHLIWREPASFALDALMQILEDGAPASPPAPALEPQPS